MYTKQSIIKIILMDININNNESNIPSHKLTLSSNDFHLSISIKHILHNEYYNASYSKEDLIKISANFISFTSIIQIYKVLIQYVRLNNNNNIIITQGDTFIIITFKKLINNDDISFKLYPSFTFSNFFTIKNKKFYFVQKFQDNNPKEINNIYFNLFYIFFEMLYIIVSLLLLLLCFFLLYKHLKISYSLSSSVIVTNKELNLLSKWINPNSVFNLTLIYRASENGDSSKIFQKSIYNRGKILRHT